MVVIAIYNNLYRIRKKHYSDLKSAYLRYKHCKESERIVLYQEYEQALHDAMNSGRIISDDLHGPFTYGLDAHFNL